MAWNEPGGGNRDPWSGGGRDQGPPDLDEVIRKLSDKFGALLGVGVVAAATVAAVAVDLRVPDLPGSVWWSG